MNVHDVKAVKLRSHTVDVDGERNFDLLEINIHTEYGALSISTFAKGDELPKLEITDER